MERGVRHTRKSGIDVERRSTGYVGKCPRRDYDAVLDREASGEIQRLVLAF
jgi:hypothetical protein